MKVRDRLTGDLITLPLKGVLPGRYEVIGQCVMFNGHTELGQGQLLLSDGSTRCFLGKAKAAFETCPRDPYGQAVFDLVSQAVRTISAYGHDMVNGQQPSPLLPQDVVKLSEVQRLEELLEETLDKGHLHEIARRPRLDMHYEEEVTAVSRARRLAPGAQRHLAANTACWQQRTLSGIVPKSILALFSDDDYAIYENKVFARLLDALETHLVVRLSKVKTLLSTFEEAQRLQAAPDTCFLLYQEVCKIWGETFDSSQTGQQISKSKSTLDMLQRLLCSVRGLKETVLYRAVPFSAKVSDQIRITNILNHDQHYRHLVPLWKENLKNMMAEKMSPAESLAQEQVLFEAYVDYVGLVMRRALSSLPEGLKEATTLERRNHDWVVTCKRTSSHLVFIPLLDQAFAGNPGKVILGTHEMRIPVFLGGDHGQDDPLDLLSEKGPLRGLVLTPLDFLVEEKVATLLMAWSITPIFEDYGKAISKVPGPVAQFLAKHDMFQVVKSSASILGPVPQELYDELKALLITHANQDMNDLFASRFDDLDLLSRCHKCGSVAQFDPRDKRAFKADCHGCNLSWGVYNENGNRNISLEAKGSVPGGFTKNGRWKINYAL